MKTENEVPGSPDEIRAWLAEQLLSEGADSEPLPASAAQQRLWLLDQVQPNRAAYNIPYACWLTGALDEAALEQAIRTIVKRHESLRARFIAEDGIPAVVIDDAGGFQLTREDLQVAPPDQRDALARKLILEESNRPFDLRQGPLIRVTLLRVEPEESVLIVNMHHIISDEWSFKIFFKELEILYKSLVSGGSPILPDLTIQYSDYADWQREWLQSGDCFRQLQFWKEELAGAPVSLNFPDSFYRRPPGPPQSALCVNRLPPQLNSELKLLATQQKATLFILLLAAFQTVLHRRTGLEDIIIGSPMAARKLLETESVIGFFANTLPLRARLSRDMPFSQLMRTTRETALGAYSNQDLPFEKIVEALQPERAPGRTPFINVLFIFQTIAEHLDLPGIATTFLITETDTAKFDLTLYIGDAEAELFTAIEYDAGQFKPEAIEELLRDLEALLRTIPSHPDQSLQAIPLCPAGPGPAAPTQWNPPAPGQWELLDRWLALRAQRRGAEAEANAKPQKP